MNPDRRTDFVIRDKITNDLCRLYSLITHDIATRVKMISVINHTRWRGNGNGEDLQAQG